MYLLLLIVIIVCFSASVRVDGSADLENLFELDDDWNEMDTSQISKAPVVVNVLVARTAIAITTTTIVHRTAKLKHVNQGC